MPNGNAHDGITLVTGAALGAAAWALSADVGVTASLVGAHVISGIMFSPDLDLAAGSYDRWGPLRFAWLPYAWVIPHRSILSHGLVIGPVLRLIYITVILGIPLWLLVAERIDPATWETGRTLLRAYAQAYRLEVMIGLVGFVTGGAAHTIADVLSSAAKR